MPPAVALIDALLDEDDARQLEALEDLERAPATARATVVRGLARRLESGAFTVDALERLITRRQRPTLGQRGHQLMLDALYAARDAGHLPVQTASRLLPLWQQKGHNPSRDVEEKSSLGARVASVFTRAWVLALSLFVVLGALGLAGEHGH